MSLYPILQVYGLGTSGTQTFGQEQVAVLDTVTGLPANGNNMQVNIHQNINGTESNIVITVPGLSTSVYTGLLRDTNPSSIFNTSFTITGFTPGAGIPPDPAADDLQIVTILTTPETAIGADDGTVTINATSSFPAIQYSLNGVTWQSSNVFTGQVSGIGTAYAKDTFNLPESRTYTVGLLGNILSSGPSVDLGNGNISNWNAAFNPIWFKYQRRDFEITSIVENSEPLLVHGGKLLVTINADMTNVVARSTLVSPIPGVPTITSPGDFVYIKTAKYEGSYEVLEKTTSTLVLDTAYTASDTVGFININSLRPGYKIQTVITYVDPVTGKFNTITSNNYPFPNGHCNVDLSSFLKSLLMVKDYSQYNLINYRDMQLSASYQIQYAEVWTGNTPQFAAIARPYYVTYTARQLQQVGGGNMQEFVPYPLGFQPAKWVCDFENPVYNNGFPFDLGFIFSEYMVGLAPFYQVVLLDINKQPLTSQSVVNAFLLNEDGTFLLNQDGSKFIIASQALGGSIVERVGLNRLLINFTPPADCWYFSVQIKYTPISGTTYPLTQPIICRVGDRGFNTDERPVYLRWIGLNGSWQYFKFVYNQVVTMDVSNTVMMKNFITDWQAADTIQDVISKNAGKSMQVFAENMTVSDIQGIEAIKFSPKVQMYVGPAISGSNWQTVIVKEGSFTEYETFIHAYNFSITFALPSINIQYQ
jgi:hypothetical protein